ncbi:MAG: c-type cytochrome [Paracoccaceae bacterium]
MDMMEWTKILGGLFGSLLVFLLINAATEPLYTVGGAHEGERHAAYTISVGEESADETVTEEAGPSLEDLVAAADPAKGQKVFSKCKACHKTEDGANAVGPHLFGVVGRPIGSVDGYKYSKAISGKGGEWNLESLFAFLESPKGWAPGTKMGFKGVAKPEDRADLIAYLKTFGG